MSLEKRQNIINVAAIALLVLIVVASLMLGIVGFPGAIGGNVQTEEHGVRVPILMYHNFGDGGIPETTVSAEKFASHLRALTEAGYTAITFEELLDFVTQGTPLPQLPVIITIDDGYLTVYETAFPILKEHDIKATVFIIGVQHGQFYYQGRPYLPLVNPHFGREAAIEMSESGIMSIQSHSYNMHHWMPYETEPREGVMQRDDESDEEYIEAFIEDFELSAALIESITGSRPFVYSYPFGRSTDLTEELLKDMGVSITLTVRPGASVVIKGEPESLFKLNRFNVRGDMTPEDLIAMIG